MWHRPTFTGWDNLPSERPLLFVGNHTLLGLLDVPLMFRELWRREGIFLNALGDRAHFRIPLWRKMLRRYGVVEGSPANCASLFEQGACVLVFPGGAREVCKRKGEAYTLQWNHRLGFARLAIEHAVTIVPFSAVGVEDSLDIVYDAEDMARTPVGQWLDRAGLRDDLRLPLVRGIGPTPIPRPERFDFHFGAPVRTASFDRDGCEDNAWTVRRAVAAEIESGIAMLQSRRAERPATQR